jgi:hypothetical protein
MPDLKNSGHLHRSDAGGLSQLSIGPVAAVAGVLAAVGTIALWWCARQGYTLYYGDAEAHLNIARRILDSRTPNGEQFGTVWLPLPHLLMIPFVFSMQAWRSGWPGAIPSCAAFVAAGTFLFAAARRVCGPSAGFVASALFAANPNMLYLASTPMTEAVFAASLAALLWATVWYRDQPTFAAVLAAAVASNAASLTRYEGWVLIPFVAAYFLFGTLKPDAAATERERDTSGTVKRKRDAFAFAALAAIGPLAWLAHNQFYFSNPLEFYNGPYSAQAIYARQIAQGVHRYPGDHNWLQAAHYYFDAMNLTIGPVALGAAALGLLICLGRKYRWPVILLALPPVFYVVSMHAGGTPVYVPALWPHTWYNTRYALAALPLAAFTSGVFIASLPRPWRLTAGIVLVVGSVAGALAAFGSAAPGSNDGRSGTVACWKESDVNSVARRAWTAEAGKYLADHYRTGGGILYPFGDMAGVLRAAGIPLKEGLHEGNHPAFDAAMARPELFLNEEWALAYDGGAVERAVLRSSNGGPHYELKRRVIVEGAPVVDIFQREPPRGQQ